MHESFHNGNVCDKSNGPWNFHCSCILMLIIRSDRVPFESIRCLWNKYKQSRANNFTNDKWQLIDSNMQPWRCQNQKGTNNNIHKTKLYSVCVCAQDFYMHWVCVSAPQINELCNLYSFCVSETIKKNIYENSHDGDKYVVIIVILLISYYMGYCVKYHCVFVVVATIAHPYLSRRYGAI